MKHEVKEVHCIVGLPGSGKTCLGRELAEKLGGQLIDDSYLFPLTCETENLITNTILVITDPLFCEAPIRARAEKRITGIAPNAVVKWYFFENDPEQCRRNVDRRNDGRKVEASIKRFSHTYRIPEGVTPIPVWRP